MSGQQKDPRVFISYSWTTVELEEWVVELARRLMEVGIVVVLDKWDLKEGQDKYAFMESMVTSDEIDKVLIICDRGYKTKADNRSGGVGTETIIITPQIYSDAKQEKFIPIVAERDEEGRDFIPAYIASRIYIDLSSADTFEDNFEKLYRNIYQVPLYKKPALGKRPEFHDQEGVNHFETTRVLRQIKQHSEKQSNRIKYLLPRYFEAFDEVLSQFQIPEVDNPSELDQSIVDKIDQMEPLISEIFELINIVCETDTQAADSIVEFFESVYKWTEYHGSGSYYEPQFDHYKYVITLLFLNTTAVCLKYSQYDMLSKIIYSEYYVNSRSIGEKTITFPRLRFYLKSLEHRNTRLNLRRASVHADMMVQYAGAKTEDLIHSDLLLYYLSKLSGEEWPWFPVTVVYLSEYNTIKFINRLKSRSHFERTKSLFNVSSEQELKEKVETFRVEESSFRLRSIPNIRNYIKPEEICSLP